MKTAAILILVALLAVDSVALCNLTEEVRKHEHKVEVVEVLTPVIVGYYPETETGEAEASAVTYDVPLEERLQHHIINTSEENGIDPSIVFAMAKRESNYSADAIGDNGASVGLLQIQIRWHWGRMKELGCLDLLDPYQNVTVGVDYLADLLEQYGDMGKALTAYNKGSYKGTVTEYAHDVMTLAAELEAKRDVQN